MHLLWSASFFHCSRSLQFIIYSAPAATSLAGVASCVLITTHTHTHNHELGHFWHMYTGRGARGQRRLLWDSALRTLARSLPRQRRVECVGTKIPPACDIVFPIGWWQTSGTHFVSSVRPLWPVAVPSVTLWWLQLPLAGSPRVRLWRRAEPAEEPNL